VSTNQKNFGELARSLTAYIGGIDAAEARRRINVAYLSEAMCHSWSFLIKKFTLQTEAAYNTGTLLVTNNSTSATLSGGTWSTAWSTAPSSRRIAIQGRFEPYDITITSPTTGTLGDPWIGATTAAANYTLWRDIYPLPADCGYAKLMALWDVQFRFRLQFKNQVIFLRDSMWNEQLLNYPIEFMIQHPSGETVPRPQIQVWPNPSTVRAYHAFYFSRPDAMTADAQYPQWPFEFQDMLVLSAAIAHYKTPRFYSPKYIKLYTTDYADMYRAAVKAFDGDSALDIIVEKAQTGRGHWAGSNAGWNPGALSLGYTGAAITGS
jgi:hypothetical protein